MAVEIVNSQNLLSRHKLVALPKRVDSENPLLAAITACELMEERIVGIFGPSTEENANGVQSICDEKEIPYIETRWDDQQRRGSALVNIHPYPAVMSKAYVDVVKAWEWKSFTILYEDYNGLSRVNELLKMYDNKGFSVVVRQLDKYKSGNYRYFRLINMWQQLQKLFCIFRPVLKDAWRSKERYFILDCTIEHLQDILLQAQQVGLMTNLHHYIITNLDMHTLDLDPFQHSETNITGVSFPFL